MPAINWNEKYSVKVKELDHQHKKLFELINMLADGMKAGKNNEQVGKIFIELLEYTGKHFKEEEQLFKFHHYPGMIRHVAEHDKLRTKAIELKSKFDAGSLVVTVELLNFLVEWVNKHILSEDQMYSAFLNSKGVQ